jgi:hypothetical protein
MTSGQPPRLHRARREADPTNRPGGVLADPRMAIACLVAAMAFALCGGILLAATLSTPVSGVRAVRGFSIAIGLAAATVGAVAVIRASGNRIGSMFLAGGAAR